MYFVDLSENDSIPRCFDYRFVVEANTKKELEEKLSKVYDDEVSVLFIDVLDMAGRDHNAQVSSSYLNLKANIYCVDKL